MRWCSTVKSRFQATGNHGSRFDGTRLGLVGDQLAEERNETEGSET